MQVPGQVVPELNDFSCRDRGARGTGKRQATRTTAAAAAAALAEPREEVGSRFAFRVQTVNVRSKGEGTFVAIQNDRRVIPG